jgi:hypothetical protein
MGAGAVRGAASGERAHATGWLAGCVLEHVLAVTRVACPGP